MILFRTDGNHSIGSGHIMRCLSIADYAKSYGEKCIFLIASQDFKKMICLHGHQAIVLDQDYRNMESQLYLTYEWIQYCEPSVMFVDSYYVTEAYLSNLHKFCKRFGTKLIYMDDLLSFPYACDVLINYNIFGIEKKDIYLQMYKTKKIISMPKMLLGPDYAPLRDEFQNLKIRKVRKSVSNILISTGGADLCHVALQLVKKILYCTDRLQDFQFHLVLGPLNEDIEEINHLIESSKNIISYINYRKLSILMQNCDLAISAAGSTLYELCATQTPTVTYILADNQVSGAREFEKRNILKCAGDIRSIGVNKLVDLIMDEIIALASNYEERERISKLQRQIVDGQGAKKILKAIFN